MHLSSRAVNTVEFTNEINLVFALSDSHTIAHNVVHAADDTIIFPYREYYVIHVPIVISDADFVCICNADSFLVISVCISDVDSNNDTIPNSLSFTNRELDAYLVFFGNSDCDLIIISDPVHVSDCLPQSVIIEHASTIFLFVSSRRLLHSFSLSPRTFIF